MLATSITAEAFVSNWRDASLKERSSAQPHFMQLCELLGVPKPTEADPTGNEYAFERRVTTVKGSTGFADVWRRGYFAWEYKGKGGDLNSAYFQLLTYRDDLENPPLLVTCDINRIVIHTNFTATPTREYTFHLTDLLDPAKRGELRQAWMEPEAFNPGRTAATVTTATVTDLMQVADSLHARGFPRDDTALFLIKAVFSMFAEDSQILPGHPFTSIINTAIDHDLGSFPLMAADLFRAMDIGRVDFHGRVPRFNGAIFSHGETPTLNLKELQLLRGAAKRDWRDMDPLIFGTLFERILDPDKRSQIGAHFTSKDDILEVIEPVVMTPLRREWALVKESVGATVDLSSRDSRTSEQLAHLATPLWDREREGARQKLEAFRARLKSATVLDPACGSGNFLYITLHRLLDLENEVRAGLALLDGGSRPPALVHPRQLHGIEVNPHAHKVATTALWIGYLQWLRLHDERGAILARDPILEELRTVENRDALLDDTGRAEWPPAEFVVGNPPFLGGKLMRTRLGDEYVNRLFAAYDGTVPREADLVCYWFEQGRKQVAEGKTARVGLIATNSVRGGVNRRVLDRLRGRIFHAWADRPWTLEGAAVRVSMIGFDDGSEQERRLDGRYVPAISADLTSGLDLTQAKRLKENLGIAFMGDTKGGAFDIPGEVVRDWLTLPNPNGRPNSDVLKPWVNGLDITRKPRGMYIIDFGTMSEAEAMMYERPYQHLLENVKPEREKNNRAAYREHWWWHVEPRPAMKAALARLERFIGTPRVAKHRLFAWLPAGTLPDSQVIVVARNDDFTFGVLHSRPHEIWALRLGTSLEDRPRYTPTSTFETFPFPQCGEEEATRVAEAARALSERRSTYLAQLGALTLTELYNKRPPWLARLHEELDRAVHAAYGWEYPLDDDEMLQLLLVLNLTRVPA